MPQLVQIGVPTDPGTQNDDASASGEVDANAAAPAPAPTPPLTLPQIAVVTERQAEVARLAALREKRETEIRQTVQARRRARSMYERQVAVGMLPVGAPLPPAAQEPPVPWRPKTRADCANVPRPCPYVSCRYHIALDVDDATGRLRYGYDILDDDGDPDPLALPAEASCALDVADRKNHTLEEVAQVIGVTRERARQIEEGAFADLRQHPRARRIFADTDD